MQRWSSHYVIGRSHEACQDYAHAGESFAALSDGCSVVKDANGRQVEAHTDIGSRLLVRAAFQHQDIANWRDYHTAVLYTADGYRRQLGMSVDCLSATLLSMKLREGGFVQTTVCGDGVVAARYRGTGDWVVRCISFDGPPYYLRYRLDNGPVPKRIRREFYTSWDPPRDLVFSDAANDGIDVAEWTVEFDLVVCVSDGAFSFTKDNIPVPFDATLANRLFDFRAMCGKFMVRHLRGVLAELAAEGIVNQDDISMIACYNDGRS